MAPSTMKAIKVISHGKAQVQEVPVPELREGCLLINVHYVAMNPIDWMNVDYMPITGASLGCDFSGIVEAVAKDVTKPWMKGERVCGWTLGNNVVRKDEGAFAEYCIANADLCTRIPDNMSDENAASPSAGISTAGMGLFQKLGMDFPGVGDGRGETVLIYGGTSATATLAIQFAKLAGYNVITTCSARSFDHVKSLGASAAFDYTNTDCAKQIREYTNDGLNKVFDTISKDNSPQICAAALSSKGGKITCTLPYPEDLGHKDVEVAMVFTLSIWGQDFGYGQQVVPGNPADFDFGKKLYSAAEKLLKNGKIKVHPPRVSNDGLEGVLDGLELVKSGKAGGVKLVYKL